MALPDIDLKIKSCETGFIVCDETGKFSKSNKCGWKPGEFSVNKVESPQLIIETPDGSSYTLDATGIPNLDKSCIDIPYSSLGMTDPKSGLYKFTLQFLFDGRVKQFTYRTYNLIEVESCIANMKAVLDDLFTDEAREVYFYSALLKSAKNAICRGDIDEANKIINFLCRKCNCKCC